MAYDRLYFLDGFDHRITGFDEFEAESDARALSTAEGRWRMAAMELWCEDRKVRHWDALGTGGSPRFSAPWQARRA